MKRQIILFSDPNAIYKIITNNITSPIEMNNPLGVILGYYVYSTTNIAKARQIIKNDDTYGMTDIALVRYIEYFNLNPPPPLSQEILSEEFQTTFDRESTVSRAPVGVPTKPPGPGATEENFNYIIYKLIKQYSNIDIKI